MKKSIFLILLSSLLFFSACGKTTNITTSSSLDNVTGNITLPLDASTDKVRGEETLIGNLVTDSLKAYAENINYQVDFAVQQGGGIRFGASATNGVYPSGNIYTDIFSEILPYGNTLTIITISGSDLKNVFEHSVSKLPSKNGCFLQLSKEVQIFVDLTKSTEAVSTNSTLIPGNRITSIKINGKDYSPTQNYTFATNSYIAGGGDTYLILKNIVGSKNIDTKVDIKEALKWYVKKNSPITPKIENRIVFQ